MQALLNSIQGAIMAKHKPTKEQKSFYFSTGCTLLDLVVGGGEKSGFGMGYEAGTIVRDWGDSSSTKTFKACEAIAANYYKYKDKFKWRYCDAELGNNLDTVGLYGFEIVAPNKKDRHPITTVEEWEYDVHKFLDTITEDECGIYVLDSLDSLSSDEMEDRKQERRKAFDKGEEYTDETYGMKSAKFLSQEMFRGLAAKLAEKNALLYVISQERDNVNAGLYGRKSKLGGGRAIKFYETARIYSKLKHVEEVKGRAVRVIIEITGEKTRHPYPWRSCLVPVSFSYGVDDIGANIDFLYDLRSAKTGELLKRAKEIEYEDGKIMTRDELITFIEENKLVGDIKQKVVDKWNSIEEEVQQPRVNKFEGM